VKRLPDDEFGVRLAAAAAAVSGFAIFIAALNLGFVPHDGCGQGEIVPGGRNPGVPCPSVGIAERQSARPRHSRDRPNADFCAGPRDWAPARGGRLHPGERLGDRAAVGGHVPARLWFLRDGLRRCRLDGLTSGRRNRHPLPVMFLLLTGYFIAIASVTNPGNLAVTIGSFVPFTPPALLPFRTATVDTPAWQIGLSLAILAASIVGTLRIAGWIYCYSLLRTGTRVTWTEARKNRHNPSL
jgi:hypothetical protein